MDRVITYTRPCTFSFHIPRLLLLCLVIAHMRIHNIEMGYELNKMFSNGARNFAKIRTVRWKYARNHFEEDLYNL